MTTMRIAMGTDNVKSLIAHFISAAKLHIDPVVPGFSEQFMSAEAIDAMFTEVAMRVTQQHYDALPNMKSLMS